jgi:hypothetical protein
MKRTQSATTSRAPWQRVDFARDEILEFKAALKSQGPFPALPKHDDLDMLLIDPPKEARKRVFVHPGFVTPCILVRQGKEYDIEASYQAARRQRDPYLAPHGMFRRLKPGDNGHALEFLQCFGPLMRRHDLWRTTSGVIELRDFWAMLARFVGVVQLWEALNGEGLSLEQAWEWIYENKVQMDNIGSNEEFTLPLPLLGCLPFERLEDKPRTIVPMPNQLLRDRKAAGRLEIFLSQSPFPLIKFDPAKATPEDVERICALAMVQFELTLHTLDSPLRWLASEQDGVPVLEPTYAPMNLWSALWQLFGLDIYGKNQWRFCRECGRMFYPENIRSLCCTPREQALWRKRVSARQIREHEKAMKLQKAARQRKKSG